MSGRALLGGGAKPRNPHTTLRGSKNDQHSLTHITITYRFFSVQENIFRDVLVNIYLDGSGYTSEALWTRADLPFVFCHAVGVGST